MFPVRFDGARGGFIKVDGVRLGPWEEVVGIVDSIETHEERGVIRILLIKRVGLEIPLNELMEGGGSLEQLKGRKISILRTDSGYIARGARFSEDGLRWRQRKRRAYPLSKISPSPFGWPLLE